MKLSEEEWRSMALSYLQHDSEHAPELCPCCRNTLTHTSLPDLIHNNFEPQWLFTYKKAFEAGSDPLITQYGRFESTPNEDTASQACDQAGANQNR